jgi:hypothetical protein
MSIPAQENFSFTKKQGQYLAYIHYYTKLNGYPLPTQIYKPTLK